MRACIHHVARTPGPRFLWFPEGPGRGSMAGAGQPVVGLCPGFNQKGSTRGAGTAKTPQPSWLQRPALHSSLHPSLTRSALPLDHPDPGFPTPGSGASILRPHQGLLWFVFYWPPIILALAPRAISSFLGGGRGRLQNPRAFMSCPCASHSLFSGKESRKLNYVANAYSSRMSGFL